MSATDCVLDNAADVNSISYKLVIETKSKRVDNVTLPTVEDWQGRQSRCCGMHAV